MFEVEFTVHSSQFDVSCPTVYPPEEGRRGCSMLSSRFTVHGLHNALCTDLIFLHLLISKNESNP
jgi:hypothetical protein